MINELRKLAKDLRLHGKDELCNKVLFVISEKTKSSDVKADLSYSFIMRKLRKNNPDKAHKFQEIFKRIFDEAYLEDLDNIDEIALMQTMQEMDLGEDIK